jgi:hypothetical protein
MINSIGYLKEKFSLARAKKCSTKIGRYLDNCWVAFENSIWIRKNSVPMTHAAAKNMITAAPSTTKEPAF